MSLLPLLSDDVQISQQSKCFKHDGLEHLNRKGRLTLLNILSELFQLLVQSEEHILALDE